MRYDGDIGEYPGEAAIGLEDASGSFGDMGDSCFTGLTQCRTSIPGLMIASP